MEEILAHHTGQPIERIHADVDRDYIMSAEEAVAYGMVDHVMERAMLPKPGEAMAR
jgi:ATP-dependent Clp protease protease subunit